MLVLHRIVQPFRQLRKLILVVFLTTMGGWLTAPQLHPAERKLDLTKAKARGIRVLEGKHLQLLTDVPASPAIDELPTVFDAAVPQWAAFFEIPLEKTANWHVRGFLMQDRAVFSSAELLPVDLPEFPNGYAYEGEFYLFNQTGDYYRRHLFLHEGTHLFHFNLAQIHSDQWYSEGVAEYLGLHEWKDGKLRLGLLPTNSDQVPKWGRIEFLQQAIRRGETLNLAQLQNLQGPSFANTVSYSWTWAAIAVMEQHPSIGSVLASCEPKRAARIPKHPMPAFAMSGINSLPRTKPIFAMTLRSSPMGPSTVTTGNGIAPSFARGNPFQPIAAKAAARSIAPAAGKQAASNSQPVSSTKYVLPARFSCNKNPNLGPPNPMASPSPIMPGNPWASCLEPFAMMSPSPTSQQSPIAPPMPTIRRL